MIGEAERARVALTVSCRDTDPIAKVEDAGQVADGIQVMHNGVRVVEGAYYGEWMTEIIRRLQGHHEPQEEVVFNAIIERLAATTQSPVMLELGAFWAYYALWLHHRVPGGRTFLVEPDPNNLEVGQRNFLLNGRSGTFLQAAVGALQTGPQPFRCESDGSVRQVPTESLASLFERFSLQRADLLLADVQGAENALLEGGKEVLAAGQVRFVLVSTHHHSISGNPLTHQRCLSFLQSIGAHVIAEHTVGESFSGDGLVAASFDQRDSDMQIEVSRARPAASLFGDPLYDLARVTAELAVSEAARHKAEEQLRAERSSNDDQFAPVVAARKGRLQDHRLLDRLGLARYRRDDSGAE